MKSTLTAFLLVFAGGGVGSICRYALALWLSGPLFRFPWATLAANGLSCFLLGVLASLSMRGALPHEGRLLLATGFCGGFSTFSSFTAETWALWHTGHTFEALANMAASLALCFLCLFLGMKTV